MRDIVEKLRPELREHRLAVDRLRSALDDWVGKFSPYITHALTLTYDESRLWRIQRLVDSPRLISNAEVLDFRKRSFRCFGQRLNRSLFGNAANRYGERMLLIGCLEGFRKGEHPHYHCFLGVPADRFEGLEDKIRSAWRKVPFAGHQIKVKPYYSAGWVGYSLKNAVFVDRDNIDWDNVRIPASLIALC